MKGVKCALTLNPNISQDWSGLRATGRVLAAIVKCLLGGFVGGWMFGLMAGVTTLYCWVIGFVPGMALGFIFGVFVSTKYALRDALFVFGIGVSVCIGVCCIPVEPTKDGGLELLDGLAPTFLGALAVLVALFLRPYIPERPRLYFGSACTLFVFGWLAVRFLIMIYTN